MLNVLKLLPAEFACPITVVQHMLSTKKSMLPELLQRGTKLRVKEAVEGEPLRAGVVYVAHSDAHLVVAAGRVAYDHSAPVHFSRPSIDVLFRAAAECYGERAVAVVLCGSNSDGSDGVRAVKAAGGTTIAESPEEAQFRIMPAAAIATGCVDYVLPLAGIAELLKKLCAPGCD